MIKPFACGTPGRGCAFVSSTGMSLLSILSASPHTGPDSCYLHLRTIPYGGGPPSSRSVSHSRGDHIARSTRGTSFVSWGSGVAKVRNSDSGAVIARLVALGGPLKHCCFSPSGEFVAGVIQDIVFIWAINDSPPLNPGRHLSHHLPYIFLLPHLIVQRPINQVLVV